MIKIGITGANGFVGSHLARKLAASFDVLCLVRHNADHTLLPKDSRLHRIDYHNPDSVSEALQTCDVLIHNAALTRAKDWQTFRNINVDLTAKLLKLSGNLQQFIFISSQAAAGPAASRDKPVLESDECRPVSLYGKSKLLAEETIRQNAEIPWTIIRPVSVFGPGDSDFLQYFRMIGNRLAPRLGFHKRFYNFIYIDDLVDLTARTVLHKKAFNEIFFASSKRIYSMKQFSEGIETAMNRKALHLPVPLAVLSPVAVIAEFLNKFSSRPPLLNREKVKEFRQRYWLASGDKARKILSFTADENFHSQLKITYQWYKQKGWL